ncbi:glutamate--cysteine ligase catalytic subunit-like isoform X2 [Mizuhopecten yessoensis]|uniref:glutamate--cysteine ligase catalytic subunit-like isoform X2 n=1 Tax=Mizuhopecten yessoensis TaxID=6573 RepID=UPI000B45D1E9|nr:glutamate--cysteine ligase catalytic subunit-like isoform X2 [Mizuhopecten yessoensis]
MQWAAMNVTGKVGAPWAAAALDAAEEGSPLSWEDTKKHADHVRKHGIRQFINMYRKLKDMKKDVLYWGDEVEYMLVKFDDEKKTARLRLDADRVLAILQQQEKETPHDHPSTWRPEYASYMVEGTPGKPYGGLFAHFNVVEANMKLRREEIQKCLGPNEVPLSLTSYPRTGSGVFSDPPTYTDPANSASRSLFYPDQVVFLGHPRFLTLTRNIRERREEKVCINIPVFKDTNTKSPFVEDYLPLKDDGEGAAAALPDHIYMDCMGFGMGCSCLQVTFQACNIDEARYLYDQLTPLCPILLALSAASPVYRGHLADIDARWTVISQSVDDRTKEERGEKELKNNKYRITKSRYDSIDSYLMEMNEAYNDVELCIDQDLCNELQEAGIDRTMSRHIAHLFIRDPISLFSEKVNQDDSSDTDHFENIQSTNWQTMRFKPPPPNSDIGWRVEFRPMEVQLSDFENAAYTVFIVLLTRVILTYNLNLVVPISKVDENLKTAHQRDAVLDGKFNFRKELFTECSPEEIAKCMAKGCPRQKCECMDDEYQQMSINDIINGNGEFPGLIPLIEKYIASLDTDVDTCCTITNYLKFISKKASGELKTTSKWIREFIHNHPAYKHDSVVSETINYDLLKMCTQISTGEISSPLVQPTVSSKTTDDIPTAMSKAEGYLNEKNTRSRTTNGLRS